MSGRIYETWISFAKMPKFERPRAVQTSVIVSALFQPILQNRILQSKLSDDGLEPGVFFLEAREHGLKIEIRLGGLSSLPTIEGGFTDAELLADLRPA
jgi:hypothetical protein